MLKIAGAAWLRQAAADSHSDRPPVVAPVAPLRYEGMEMERVAPCYTHMSCPSQHCYNQGLAEKNSAAVAAAELWPDWAWHMCFDCKNACCCSFCK